MNKELAKLIAIAEDRRIALYKRVEALRSIVDGEGFPMVSRASAAGHLRRLEGRESAL